MKGLAALFYRDLSRLVQEIQSFPDTASLWVVRPGITNSAGNLALHLEGNLREYVGRQLGGIEYTRDRPAEFGDTGVLHRDMVNRLMDLRETIIRVLEKMEDDALDAPFPTELFGAPISTSQALFHLLGHFSYHLGQIDYLRRVVTGEGAISLASL